MTSIMHILYIFNSIAVCMCIYFLSLCLFVIMCLSVCKKSTRQEDQKLFLTLFGLTSMDAVKINKETSINTCKCTSVYMLCTFIVTCVHPCLCCVHDAYSQQYKILWLKHGCTLPITKTAVMSGQTFPSIKNVAIVS